MQYRLLFIGLCCLAPWAEAVADGPELVLNTAYGAPLNAPDKSGALDQFYQALFARLGLTFEIQALPAERALTNANNGIDGGDVARVAGLDSVYPNLVRVPEPIMRYEHVIFSRNHNPKASAANGI